MASMMFLEDVFTGILARTCGLMLSPVLACCDWQIRDIHAEKLFMQAFLGTNVTVKPHRTTPKCSKKAFMKDKAAFKLFKKMRGKK